MDGMTLREPRVGETRAGRANLMVLGVLLGSLAAVPITIGIVVTGLLILFP